jgi:phosphatidylserine/phosphatidylglycerophosphate/cardiolipin synthase-like enzyme
LKLLIQPEGGVAPILTAIHRAKSIVEIAIFRLDHRQIEEEIEAAAQRRVFVRALVAFDNRGGERQLRRLESRFLASGVTVSRTADDLVRYHAKMLIIDRKTLYVLSYNYTAVDVVHSRAFGIVTRNRALVQEAVKLFEADTKRHPYVPQLNTFLVSPLNARKQLGEFIRKARKELLIYDPKISDSQMINLLLDRQEAGVEIKVLGRLGKGASALNARRLTSIRLHTRTIIRDRKRAFVGSQSLRKLELDARREVGLIVKDLKVVSKLAATFESDWEANQTKESSAAVEGKKNKKVTKIAKKLNPLSAEIKRAVKKVVIATGEQAITDDETKETLKQAVKKTVKQAFKEAVQETAARVENNT